MLQRTIAAIDIGTTKICVLIASVDSAGLIDVIGFGKHPSYGMKKGVIVNINSTVQSIKHAIAQAEQMAGLKIESVSVGVSGGHINSLNSKGVVAISKGDVSQRDIDRVIDAAKAVALPTDREILHVIPQYFRVDEQEFVQDSLGMYGVRLEAQVHIITGGVSSAQNIIKACELAGVRVSDIVLEQLASAEAVLTESERELGVGILDIGGGTSDFAIYKEGRIRHSRVFPVAGSHFTNDLAIGIGAPIHIAEELKRNFGFVVEEKYLEFERDTLEVDLGFDDAKKIIETYRLFEILEPRAEEILELLEDEINLFLLRKFMLSGLVMTGGGSLLSGFKELAEQQLQLPVRVGSPLYEFCKIQSGKTPDMLRSPMYSTAYGLLVYTVKQGMSEQFTGSEKYLFTRVFNRMKSWIHDFI